MEVMVSVGFGCGRLMNTQISNTYTLSLYYSN